MFSDLIAALVLLLAVVPAKGAVNVTEHHNHDSRDGLYVDPAFTPAAAANLKRDTNFNGASAATSMPSRSTSRAVRAAGQ